MDHKEAVHQMAAERYLLDEFTPEEREEFEEHLFCCEHCAADVKAGSLLMETSRRVLAFTPEQGPAPQRARLPRRDWFAWLRPAFAVPAMALLLGVVFFQNVVVIPEMHSSLTALNAPAILPSADLASGNTRGDGHTITARPGEVFQLTIDIPDSSGAAHTVQLYNSTGEQKWSLPVPADAPRESLSLRMPGDLPAGSYALVLRKVGAAPTDEISRYTFSLRR